MIRRIMRELFRIVEYRVNPVAYHRRRGARIGDGVEIISGGIHTLGSEPYLVTIGSGVTISHGVDFITHDGGLRVVRDQYPGAYMYAPITIGDNAFIGARTILMPGVTVGARAVVGAGSIVTHDIPPETVAVGTPARPIGSIHDYAARSQDRWLDTSNMNVAGKEQALRQRFGLVDEQTPQVAVNSKDTAR